MDGREGGPEGSLGGHPQDSQKVSMPVEGAREPYPVSEVGLVYDRAINGEANGVGMLDRLADPFSGWALGKEAKWLAGT